MPKIFHKDSFIVYDRPDRMAVQYRPNVSVAIKCMELKQHC